MLDVTELYREYLELLKTEPSPEKVLAQFDYLHPITLAKLVKVIREQQKKINKVSYF